MIENLVFWLIVLGLPALLIVVLALGFIICSHHDEITYGEDE